MIKLKIRKEFEGEDGIPCCPPDDESRRSLIPELNGSTVSWWEEDVALEGPSSGEGSGTPICICICKNADIFCSISSTTDESSNSKFSSFNCPKYGGISAGSIGSSSTTNSTPTQITKKVIWPISEFWIPRIVFGLGRELTELSMEPFNDQVNLSRQFAQFSFLLLQKELDRRPRLLRGGPFWEFSHESRGHDWRTDGNESEIRFT